MHLMLHTFRKDVTRLWPGVAASWALLAMLSWQIAHHQDAVPYSTETWLMLILTLVWACLVGWVVLEEPLVGDRNFWTTRPHRWTSLVAAKLLFVVVAIHVSGLVADSCVLGVLGFNPAAHLGTLAMKQLLLFGAITLSALAIASVVRNFSHFAIAGLAAALATRLVGSGFAGTFMVHPQVVASHHMMVWSIVAAGALMVVGFQYAWRRELPARAFTVLVALFALSMANRMPAGTGSAAVSGNGIPAPEITMQRSGDPPNPHFRLLSAPGVVVLPIHVADTPYRYRLYSVQVDFVLPDGKQSGYSAMPMLRPDGLPSGWTYLAIPSRVWTRVKDLSVSLRVTMPFYFWKPGKTTAIPLSGGAVAGLGRCRITTVDSEFDGLLRVLCESPEALPARAAVFLRSERTGREWRAGIGGFQPSYPGVMEDWLSPLHRAKTYFHLTANPNSIPSSQWLVPWDELRSMHLEVTPEISLGRAVATAEFPNVRLSDWQTANLQPESPEK